MARTFIAKVHMGPAVEHDVEVAASGDHIVTAAHVHDVDATVADRGFVQPGADVGRHGYGVSTRNGVLFRLRFSTLTGTVSC